METNIHENKLSILLDQQLYSKEVLAKCFYWYGGEYDVSIHIADGSRYCVTIVPKQESGEDTANFQHLISNVCRSLSDYQLREMLDKETKHIRNLLVSKAFSFCEAEQEDPDTRGLDPLAFYPAADKP